LLWPVPTKPIFSDEHNLYVHRRVLVSVIAVVLLGAGTGAASAQPNPAPRTRLGAWVARTVSPGSILGALPDGRLDLLGLRYARRLIPTARRPPTSFDGPTLTYTADLIPVARLHVPAGAMPNLLYLADDGQPTALSTYGLGAYPLGVQVTFRFREGVRPFVAGHTGGLYFLESVPDPRGQHFNFAAGIGAGVELALPRGTSVTLGYRYHHLSNGFRGSINPGLDANLLYLLVDTAL
jgi:opacity protein-like surface antigen